MSTEESSYLKKRAEEIAGACKDLRDGDGSTWYIGLDMDVLRALIAKYDAERQKAGLWFGKVADLEAALKEERQRADKLDDRAKSAEAERDKNIAWHSKQLKRANDLEAELAELKGDQVPVAEIRKSRHGMMGLYWHGKQSESFPEGTQFYTAPQKPVVLPPLASIHSNWSGEYLDKADVIAAIEASGGIVKDGE